MHQRMGTRRSGALRFFALLAILTGWTSFASGIRLADAETPASVPVASSDELIDLESRFKSISDKVSPSVVAISASLQANNSPSACRTDELSSDKLQAFLSRTTRMVGTGFIIDPEGYILTNDHVIDDAEQLWITTDDRKVYPAIVVGSDPRGDLAILKIPGHNLPAVHLGDGSSVRRGQWSIAIGNPYGLSGGGGMCVSVGVVSAVHRSLPKLSESENRLYANLIQTTAQINPGNSGGPLFDLHGDVIGINTAVIMPQKSINGIGFALPVDEHMLDSIEKLKQGTEVVYAYLGVTVTDPSDEDRKQAGIDRPIGVRVDAIHHDSPAASGILREGDILTAIGHHAVDNSESFVQMLSTLSIDKPAAITLVRDGTVITARVRLVKRTNTVSVVTRQTQRLRWGGMLLAVPESEHQTGLVVLEITPSSPFIARGIHEGTLIRSVAGKAVHNLIELQTVINDTPFNHCDFVTDSDSTSTADVR